jgi:RNA polymerase sigma-70 factor (ECF subfamily)
MAFELASHRERSDEEDGLARRFFDTGRAAWPDLTLSFEAFETYFVGRVASGASPDIAHAGDMYVACACAFGIDGAIDALERTCVRSVARAVATIDSSPAFVEDVLQETRARLLVRSGQGPSAIADYSGRASLKSWLSAVALRWAISVRRRKGAQPHEPLSAEDDDRLATSGTEFLYLRARYKQVFEDAVRAAVAGLSPRQRLLLRLNVLEGMSVDALGAVYRVGRSTAARWLADARETLREAARREVQERLQVTSNELDSLADDIRSDFDVSLATHLAQPA